MWPVPGYWSMDEWTAPTRCRVAEACPGVDLTVALRPGPNGTVLPIETDIDTTPCAEGYMGRSCVQCEAGFYQLDGGSCFPCGSHTDQTRELALAALVSVCVMLVLAGAVAFLSAAHLAQWFQLFCVLQDLAVVGADGAKSAPMFRAQLVTAFRYISLVNFVSTHCGQRKGLSSSAVQYLRALTGDLIARCPGCPTPFLYCRISRC